MRVRWEWCAIGIALVGCRAIEDRGLGEVVPGGEPPGDQEPARPASNPVPPDAGAFADPGPADASLPSAPDAAGVGADLVTSPPPPVTEDAAAIPPVMPDA